MATTHPTVPHAMAQDRALLRYSNGAVLLHWLTVVVILAQIYVGFTFHGMERGPERMEWFTWHKTLGATILVLALIRLAWRLTHKPPPYPPELPRWERVAATWNHRIFYVLLIALPLTGLTTISGELDGSVTPLVGGIPLPLIPGVSHDASETLGAVHILLVWTTIALVALHVAAALKHQFIDRSKVAGRMPPFRSPEPIPVIEKKR